MAILGVQLVVTLLTATLMHRLAPHCSFARWLLCNGSLFRYKQPSEEELRALAGRQRPRGRKDRWANGYSEEKTLCVPRDAPFQLQTCPLTAVDALVLRFFLEYQWFVDFAVYSGGVYLFTEAYYYVLGPARETNIAVFWCLLTIAFSIKVFLTVTRLYFSAKDQGERSVCLTFAFLFLLLAMLVQVVPEETLELGLEPGLASMTQNLEPLLKMQGWDWMLPLVKLVIRVGLSVLGSMLGAFLTFPGLRLAQTHRDALTMSEDRPMLQFLLHTSFLSPLFILWLWAKPIARNFLYRAPLGGTPFFLLSDSAFDSLRLWVLVALCLLRLAVIRPHLQAYLCLAKARVEQLRREAGRIEACSTGLLLPDSGEPAVPDATHPHSQLHTVAQDAGWLLLGPGPSPPTIPSFDSSPRWPNGPQRGRSPAGGGPDHWGPGWRAHTLLPPWHPGLPHLVDCCLPAAFQPLRPLLPPAPGRLLAT
ncbi:transmembrane protein 161A isoform X2 [Molossus molossus]|uniref:transmembrane protein 161A isoform X2 n=1 Tax=Molossus molossus TaxID=27622 RepID=UPI00174691B7|nr:transmembrane protein 161A isoform X2 [Molossus molossus]